MSWWIIRTLLCVLLITFNNFQCTSAFKISVEAHPDLIKQPVTGRVLVYISKNNNTQPRKQCDDGPSSAQAFGVDVTDFTVGKTAIIDDSIFGYPLNSLSQVPVDQHYYMQVELLMYDTYKRGDGHTVVLPVSCVNPSGNDGSYDKPAGTLYSSTTYQNVKKDSTIKLTLDRKIPTGKSPGCAGGGRANSKYIKTVHYKSESLSKFWGRDIILEACVLLPGGFEEHPDAHYPLVIAHGHYSAEWDAGGAFSEEPPPANLTGYAKIAAQYAYYLFKNWTAADLAFKNARMLIATINHDVPFFDDSYAVNSANMGPYGDAITYELVPYIEKMYRGIGQGWARAVFGGSTGGWESLAVQVLYPDEYNGAYASCPDPISFTSYSTVNIYKDKNAYFYDSDWKRTPKPAERDHYSGQTIGYGHPYGQTTATMEEVNHRELVLGEHSRSCGQWDIWEAVFGPVDSKTGYPQRMYNKMTGEIYPKVAEYWKKYDLREILKSNWATLGPKLVGKMHIYVGNSDTYFLTNAVMDMEDFLETTTNPYYDGEVVIGVHKGRGFEHCYSGYAYAPDGSVLPNSITRLTYSQRFLPIAAKWFVKTAPSGADMSWRY